MHFFAFFCIIPKHKIMQKLQIRHLTNWLVLEKEDHDKKKKNN